MGNDVSIYVNSSDRAHLEQLMADRDTAAEGRVACWDRVGQGGGARHDGDHAAHRHVEAMRLALAGWAEAALKPHLVNKFKLSNDPMTIGKRSRFSVS